MDAIDAEKAGLVSKIFPAEDLVNEAVKNRWTTSSLFQPNSYDVKNLSTSLWGFLAEGLHFERRLFHSTFATADRVEGMSAFWKGNPKLLTIEE
jgi:enoyl-CoA hydratase